jgi:hypothetical protein
MAWVSVTPLISMACLNKASSITAWICMVYSDRYIKKDRGTEQDTPVSAHDDRAARCDRAPAGWTTQRTAPIVAD